MTVSQGNTVSIEYTLTGEDGAEIESNAGGDPLVYIHGIGQIIPGLEKGLEGMNLGDSKKISVSPEEGYGVIDSEAFVEVPKDNIPEEARKIGAQLQSTGENGEEFFPIVTEVKDDVLVLDFNHPMAGKTLNFDVKVTDIQETLAQE